MIKSDSIERLKSIVDIVDVIGSSIELKKAGVNFKACCPFHDEKSASFIISPVKQIYHCFGCHASGDAVKFVMEYDKLTYPEALEKLAKQFNFSLDYDTIREEKPKTQVLETFNAWYRKNMATLENVHEYLHKRGIHASMIEKFELGFAPSSEKSLLFIKEHLIDPLEAVKTGMLGEENGRYYPRFIERLTFAIRNANGGLIAFGGRTLSNHPAKYLNSPQTELFNKSRVLYAYHLAKETIHRKKEIIVTEGYVDVLMLHQAGFTQAVATLGTALTKEHLPLLKRGEPRVIVAYDGDEAGKNAALKAAMLLSSSGVDGGVVLFEGGMDPADMVANGHLDTLNKLFHTPRAFARFVIETLAGRYDLNIPEAKQKALDEITPFLRTLSPVLQEEYGTFTASLLAISHSLIDKSVHKISVMPFVTAEKRQDTCELSLIKSALDNSAHLGYILDFLTPEMINYHKDEFEFLRQGIYDAPVLMGLLINDSIKSLSLNEIREQIVFILKRYHEKALTPLAGDKTLSWNYKTYWIRRHRAIITDLLKGKLESSLETNFN